MVLNAEPWIVEAQLISTFHLAAQSGTEQEVLIPRRTFPRHGQGAG
jgi:hypothetical protein